jgi:integrase
MRMPKYRKHSTRNVGFVEWKKKRHYFKGAYNSIQSIAEYKKFVLEHVGSVAASPKPIASPGCTVNVLCRDFLVQLREQSLKNLRGTYGNYRNALQPFCKRYGNEQAASIGPRLLKEWQKELASKELSRGYINGSISKIKQVWRWAASEEILPASVWHGLQSVKSLAPGKTPAREAVKRKPLPWSHLQELLPSLSPNVRAMVLLQWHSGARSQSIVMACPSQFERDGDFLLWRPRHKTETWGEGKELVIPLGPRAQEVIGPFLKGRPDRPMFCPRWFGKNPRYGDRYTSGSYHDCIQHAIRRLNKRNQVAHVPALPLWTPHQLRHAKGHAVRKIYGLEAAQAVLGHESLSATEIYSARRLDLAKKVAWETG